MFCSCESVTCTRRCFIYFFLTRHDQPPSTYHVPHCNHPYLGYANFTTISFLGARQDAQPARASKHALFSLLLPGEPFPFTFSACISVLGQQIIIFLLLPWRYNTAS